MDDVSEDVPAPAIEDACAARLQRDFPLDNAPALFALLEVLSQPTWWRVNQRQWSEFQRHHDRGDQYAAYALRHEQDGDPGKAETYREYSLREFQFSEQFHAIRLSAYADTVGRAERILRAEFPKLLGQFPVLDGEIMKTTPPEQLAQSFKTLLGLVRAKANAMISAEKKGELAKLDGWRAEARDIQERLKQGRWTENDVPRLWLLGAYLARYEQEQEQLSTPVLNAAMDAKRAWEDATAVAAVKFNGSLEKLRNERAYGDSAHWKQLATTAALQVSMERIKTKSATLTTTEASSKPRATKAEYNLRARRVLQNKPPTGKVWSYRALAQKIGCASGTVKNLPAYQAYVESLGGHQPRGKKVVSLTDSVERNLGSDDATLADLIEESNRDNSSDPSPLSNARCRVRGNRKL